MRAFKTHRSACPSTFALVAMLAVACTPDGPTDVASLDPSLAQARNSSPSYTSTNLGALPGDNSSRANGVNDAGEVAGYSCCSLGYRGFVRVSGVLTPLTGDNGNALAISNGSQRFVVGFAGATSQPVRWTIAADGALSPPEYLPLGAATSGAARGVNDAGQAVGNVGDNAAMWLDGSLILVSAPEGFVRGEGRAIDNAGHAVFVFFRPDAAWPDGISIGYLRLAPLGELIPLPPIATSGISYANGLTSVTGDTVGIAGSSYTSPSAPSAVRWTVDVVQKLITGRQVRPETSHAVGISDGWAATGFVEGPLNSLKSTAFRWQGTQMLSLNPPKSGKEGKGWAISPNGIFVAGEAIVQGSRTAILWKISPP
jgi:hypothetical protein